MNQSSKHVSSDGETPQSVGRSLLEFLKPKSEERYSKLEAYCDLLSRASAGAYVTPEAEGALQLLPGQFVATISEGRTRAKEVAESYNRYYALKLDMAKKEGNGGIPARHVLNEQTVIFDGLAVSMLHVLDAHKQLPEELSDSVGLLFGKDHVWDWHKVIATLGIMAAALRTNSKPSYMAEVASEYSKGEVILMDCIFEHYSSGVESTYYDNPPCPSMRGHKQPPTQTPSVSSSAENNDH